jgi:hypothetical protein
MADSSPDPYRVTAVKRDSRGSARVLVVGPGTGAGVWYPVSRVRDAAELVDSLNLALLYARDLKTFRSAGQRRKRNIH